MGYQILIALDSYGDVWCMTDGEPYKIGLQAVSISVGRNFVIA